MGRVQVVTVFGGPEGHAAQLEPHVATLESDTHCVPQRWLPEGHVKSQMPF